MRQEVPVITVSGIVVPGRRHLIDQLHQEAAQGQVRVNCYRGEYGAEAFYTLSDGTLLHEVNHITDDGAPFSYINQVMPKQRSNLWGRLFHAFKSPALNH